MPASVREPPPDFVRRLRAAFPDFVELRWNTHFGRWEFVFLSAAGRPVSQFWGWFKNPMTGAPIPPDPAELVPPFRDLDASAQEEIMASLRETFIGNLPGATGNGVRDWRETLRQRTEQNDRIRRSRVRQRAHDLADAIAEFDIRRPGWLKEHSPEGRRLLRKQHQRIEVVSR